MTHTVRHESEPYTRESLSSSNLVRVSPEMQWTRVLWGTNKKTFVDDTEELIFSDPSGVEVYGLSGEDFSVFDEEDSENFPVLFDLEIDPNIRLDSEFEEFVTTKSPLNWSPIRPLIPGEYEYQHAIVGTQLDILPVEGRFGLVGSTLHIDVPDTVEKGTVTVTSAGPTEVHLNKKFYKEAKVLTSLLSADEVARIEVSQIGLDGFKVALRPLTNPTAYVNGIIDWLVEGY